MRVKLLVSIAVLLVQLFLAATPWIPYTAGWWSAKDPQAFYNTFATFMAVQMVLFSAAIILILSIESSEMETRFRELAARVPGAAIRRLNEEQFYKHFLAAAKEAAHSVLIAYFAAYPPTDIQYRHRRRYYKAVIALMKRRTTVHFKRLIRASARNEPWVAELLRELRNRPNIDVALLTRDLPDVVEMPLALSVQLIDDRLVWIVASSSHEDQQGLRDLFVESAEFAAVMGGYYERLWSVSTLLLDRGRLTDVGEQLLRRIPE